MSRWARRAAVPALLVTAAALPACGGGGDDGGGPGGAGADAFSAVERKLAAGQKRAQRVAAPRWETVTELTRTGDSSARFRIAADAIQWRARWRCSEGELELVLGERTLGAEGCPGEGVKSSVASGAIRLEVRASAAWRLTIEQQVETPLREPPLPEMRSGEAELLAAGRFYPIENRGSGSARLYRLDDGRLALRLQRFHTAGNPGLFVWLSRDPGPRTTKQALAATYVEIGKLKSTLGDQNYLLPNDLGPEEVRSVVIWCKPIQIAYTAATLGG